MIKKTLALAAWLVALALSGAAMADQRRSPLTFDGLPAGAAPSGFAFAAMRQPSPGVWSVGRTGSRGHLVHAADAAAEGLSLAIAPTDALRDLVISVRLRLSGGPRAGGLVWRYQDSDNFYAAILDLREAELSLYRVLGGNMIKIEHEGGLELDPEAWHTLKVVHNEDDVRVSLGGIRVFDERDRRHGRLYDEGGAGVVSAGAAEVWFDDLRIEPHHHNRR